MAVTPSRAVVEAAEPRVLFASQSFVSAAGGLWSTNANWSGAAPGPSDSAFITGGQTATIAGTSGPTGNVYAGQGAGNGTVDMTGGSLTSTGVYLGRDAGTAGADSSNYGLWYQTGGTLDAGSFVELGTALQSSGELVDKGGSVTTATANVGVLGYGALTVAGGAFSAGTVNIASGTPGSASAYPGFTDAGSYLNVNSGTLAVEGSVNIGTAGGTTPGLMKLSGGSSQWGGDLDVEGAGSSLVVEGDDATLGSWSGPTAGATALTLGTGTTFEFDLLPQSVSGAPLLDLGSLGEVEQSAGATLVIDGSELNYVDGGSHTYQLVSFGGLAAGSTPFSAANVVLKGFTGRTCTWSESTTGIRVTVGPYIGVGQPSVVSTGQVTSLPVDADHSTAYDYAPSFTYDETEGLYKVWTGYHVTVPTTPAVLFGSVIGTAGSFGDSGNDRFNAFDGSLSTYFDAPTADGSWTGLDLGTPHSVSSILFAPRPGYATRMVGGVFQASSTPDFSSDVVTLATITTAPVDNGTFTTLPSGTSAAYRYARYLSPDGSFGDVAEVEFLGTSPDATTASATANNTTPGGDDIGFKESPTIAGLQYAPIRDSLQPQVGSATAFDRHDVADPSVYRDPSTGTYYMAYSGYPLSGLVAGVPTQVGLAESFDGGRTFVAQYTAASATYTYTDAAGDPASITETGMLDLSAYTSHNTNATGTRSLTNGYGTGQPSVTYDPATATFYMAFTDSPRQHSAGGPSDPDHLSSTAQRVDVISSPDADFHQSTAVAYIVSSAYFGAGADVMFDQVTGQLLFASDPNGSGDKSVAVSLVAYAPPAAAPALGVVQSSGLPTLLITDPGQGFVFGEQIGLLTNAEGYMVAAGCYSFAGSSDVYAASAGPVENLTVVASDFFQLRGATYGTVGSSDGDGDTVAAATDGDLTTFFSSPTPAGNVGIDLGSAEAVTQIAFAPRAGYAGRMVGGTFQFSATEGFSSGVTTIETVTAAPAEGVLTTCTLATPVAARYWRYLGPVNGYGNVAEFQLFGV